MKLPIYIFFIPLIITTICKGMNIESIPNDITRYSIMEPLDQTSQLALGLTSKNYYDKYQALRQIEKQKWTKQKRARINLIKQLKHLWEKDFPNCSYNFNHVMATMAKMHDAQEWMYNDKKIHFYANELSSPAVSPAPIAFNETNTACAFLATYNKLTGNKTDRNVVFICAYEPHDSNIMYHIEQTPTISTSAGVCPESRSSISFPACPPFFINNTTVCALVPRVSTKESTLYTFSFNPSKEKTCISRACFLYLKDGNAPLSMYSLNAFPALMQNIIQDKSSYPFKGIIDTDIIFKVNDVGLGNFINELKNTITSDLEKNNDLLLQYAISYYHTGNLGKAFHMSQIYHKNIHKIPYNSRVADTIHLYRAFEKSSPNNTKPLENFLKSHKHNRITRDCRCCELYWYTINNCTYKKLYIEDRRPYGRPFCVNGQPIIVDNNTECTAACNPIEETGNRLYKVALLCTDTYRNQKISLYKTGITTETIHKGDIIISDTKDKSLWQKCISIGEPLATNITFDPTDSDILHVTMSWYSKYPSSNKTISGISEFFNKQ